MSRFALRNVTVAREISKRKKKSEGEGEDDEKKVWNRRRWRRIG